MIAVTHWLLIGIGAFVFLVVVCAAKTASGEAPHPDRSVAPPPPRETHHVRVVEDAEPTALRSRRAA